MQLSYVVLGIFGADTKVRYWGGENKYWRLTKWRPFDACVVQRRVTYLRKFLFKRGMTTYYPDIVAGKQILAAQ